MAPRNYKPEAEIKKALNIFFRHSQVERLTEMSRTTGFNRSEIVRQFVDKCFEDIDRNNAIRESK